MGDDHVTLDPVEAAVLVVRRPVALSPAERAVVAVALALLGLLRRDVEGERGRIARLAAAALLRAEATDVEDVLGPGPHRVVAGRSREDHDVLARRYGPLVSKLGDGFLALVPAGFAVSGPVGVSSPVPAGVPSAAAFGAAAAEASGLLARAVATGSPALPASDLTSLLDPAVAAAFARRELAALLGRPELVETLRAWLGRHGSWDRTAEVLGVHRNSVRHRIAHVERLLGRDLGSADARAALWLALTWLD
ncbi:helix-turn-helix domain-containing protein [Lentzea sp. NPDC042327]|uniref:PucR family transcriptional regulator n=1 Tax=Lentzea sp. NPDC042327 TaxID=3154801 RepID=UPI0033FCE7DD